MTDALLLVVGLGGFLVLLLGCLALCVIGSTLFGALAEYLAARHEQRVWTDRRDARRRGRQ